MPRTILYLTHPQVNIDPDAPVPEWSLSDEGAQRVRDLAESGALALIAHVYCSEEVKALETAGPLAEAAYANILIRPKMGENDRSATGFLPADAFESHADAFFATPHDSINGWETSADAQARILAAVKAALDEAPDGDILFVGHGAVGTLLYCACAEVPIDRKYDQGPGGGGNYVTYDEKLRPLHHWRPMEDLYKS
ncbi:MAG: histidine phosphatase family protein [Pseudomonadota bacterium]